MHAKKRHHFVPKAYLRAFANDKGRVLVYRKDEPQKVLAVAPDATAFERYYYSQPTPEGGLDHNRLEDEFSKLEGVWPPLVSALHKGENVNDSLLNLFQFIILQRVRVPAARDATEARLAGEVHQLMLDLTASGRLPPPPPELAGRLDEVVVSIDPHKSIHGMVDDIKAAQWVFDNVGLCAIRNKTATPFLTSDNPVIWFDPSLPLADQEPYGVKPGGAVRLVFTISPSLVLVGASEQRQQFASEGLMYGEVTDEDWVFRVNLDICRYAYKAVYASQAGQEDLIAAFADESPVWLREGAGGRLVFGPRASKPKWESRQ